VLYVDNIIKESFLMPFTDKTTGFRFKGSRVYSHRGHNVLLGKEGQIILLNDYLLKEINDFSCSDDLLFKLLQRKFAVVDSVADDDFDSKENIRPTFFMIDMTRHCNMCCRYCLRSLNYNGCSISNKTIDDICHFIIRYCEESGVRNISVQPWGGEPLLEFSKIERIQDWFLEKGIFAKISVETNGILLHDEMIEKIIKRGIFVSVSIDGPASVHDQQRQLADGAPSHRLVEAGLLRLFKALNGDVSVIVVLTRNSLNKIDEIVDYFAKDIRIERLKMNFVYQSNFSGNVDLCLRPDEIRIVASRLLEKLIALNNEGTRIFEYNIYQRLKNLLARSSNDICISRGCRGGKKLITFDMDGNIFPCDVTDFPEEKIGSIYDGRSLGEIVKDAVKKNSYFAPKMSELCLDCPWRCYCQGGCTVHIKSSGEHMSKVDMIHCSTNRELYPQLVQLILQKPNVVNLLVGRNVIRE
jgi:uncharacterized protein